MCDLRARRCIQGGTDGYMCVLFVFVLCPLCQPSGKGQCMNGTAFGL